MRKLAVAILAKSFIALIIYAMAALALFATSAVMLNMGIVSSVPIMIKQQIFIYRGGHIRQWQSHSNCVEFDRILLYKPKVGECWFENAEFKTRMRFDALGRVSSGKNNRMGIAVLGDSHAMGWGVHDDETFSARLEKKTNRPVYNLGVASYATRRELLALERSGLINDIDLIIIQYSENDLFENLNESTAPRSYRQEQFETFRGHRLRVQDVLVSWLVEALISPAREGKRFFYPPPIWQPDFLPHYEAMQNIFSQFPWLKTKAIVIFYVNAYGLKFANFAEIVKLRNHDHMKFIDLNIGRDHHYAIDDHLTKAGHELVAIKLAEFLKKL